MKKTITLSLLVFSSLYASEIELAPINVESTTITEVAQNAQTSADVAAALSTSVPGIDMSRRSGIANDVLIRGQKRDNISVEVDGTKVYGACPNRMDPPVSHILANQIDAIEVIEGPYDVENYGNLSGGLKISTKKPSKDFQGQVNLGFGSWNYKKFGATASGGNNLIRVLVTASTESSDQYHDGNSDTLAQQVKKQAPTGNQYQSQYEDMQAYKKNSMMAKAFVTTAKDQELQLSVTANRSDNILYPNSPMDAIYDDSNIYSVTYNIDNISDTYKNINLQYYYSDVDHPMSTEYRKSALTAANNKTNHMWTTMQGVKLKNSFDINSYNLLFGLDGSRRTWKGQYVNNVSGTVLGDSIDHALTKNSAVFAALEKQFDALHVKIGARYDHSTVRDDNSAHQANTYNGLGTNIFTTYALNSQNKLFLGLGQAYRVPDGRELYFLKGGLQGTPTLNQTKNQEVDFGYETDNDYFKLKVKGFYSKLKNYIYINSTKSTNIFENIDAKIYGAELSGSYYINDDITLDIGASYKRGKKDHALNSQTNTNLADIAPLRANAALNYEYANNSIATLEMQASKRWNNIDDDNGEQVLAGWAVFNAKIKHALNKKFDFTLGVNNMFNTTYAQSNTYTDLTLVTTGSGEKLLLNEPGRYIYTNLDFKF
ncbi:TonB-dependent receptor domain-containing protein [Sulfurimonas autotrophica]|uniref:TonB-dependent receptor n=1 Tax=Sulfurimonas autotrophica (strain ATCC BAA-671 / DSM 16294 / JCM 11897 / OK10) TaxID=563040 RepID=E0UUF6_SULAO|nr:TonB-dependent receptor [Sulfurimonas autotrophica]ADN08392.1 TonB-dependent receptor [Sulfurimonas autotrophica DSM 16294]